MHRVFAAACGLLLAVGLWLPAAIPSAAALPAYSPDAEEATFADLINAYRGQLGLGPLTLQAELGAAADFHSADMAANGYFDHYALDGTSPEQNIRNFGYSGGTWGENIAAGMDSAAEAMTTWQNSPPHDAAMRNPNFRELGIGREYDEGSPYGWYWTATFGGGEAAPARAAPSAPDAAPADGSGTTTTTGPDGAITTMTVDAPTVAGDGTESGVSTEDGTAQQSFQQVAVPDTNADGGYVADTGRTASAVDATGEGIVYGDITTGDQTVSEPPSSTVGAPPPADGGATATNDPGTVTSGSASGGCLGAWFDEQLAYEGAGGLGGDPAYVNAVDPDWDGIACEASMTTG